MPIKESILSALYLYAFLYGFYLLYLAVFAAILMASHVVVKGGAYPKSINPNSSVVMPA